MITILIQYSIIIIIIIIETIKGLNKQEVQVSRAVESEDIQNQQAKDKLKREYTWKLRRVLKFELTAENKITITGSLSV
jgi:hypothetical protein